MTPKEFARLLNALNLSEAERINKILDEHSKAVADRLEVLLRKHALELNDNGSIKPTPANFKKVSKIINDLEATALRKSLFTRWASLSSGFSRIAALSRKFYKSQDDDFAESILEREETEDAIRRVTALITRSEVRRILVDPIRDTINHYIRRGASFSQLNDVLRDAVTNQPISSAVDQRVRDFYRSHRGVRLLARDSVFQFTRDYQMTVNETAQLDWFYYSGSIKGDSREFCIERSNKFFHKKEIRSWPSSEGAWQGRRPGTNERTIFRLLGGYNCGHELIPVSIVRVPIKDVRRAVRKKYVKRADLPESIKKKL